MRVLYPEMLWGLLLLLLPIIIHLFHFRRYRTLYFSNTALLKEIKREDVNTKRLKHMLILFLRLICIAALTIAFAYPYIGSKQLNSDKDNNLVGIFIDNSMSMEALNDETSLFETARQSAKQLVASLKPSNQYVLLSNDYQIQNEYPMSMDEFLNRVDELQITSASTSLGKVVEQFAMIKRKNNFSTASLFVYSDYQDSFFQHTKNEVDTTIQYLAIPLRSKFQENVYIDSVWLTSPIVQQGLDNELHVRVVNDSKKTLNAVPVSFKMNNQSIGVSMCDLLPHKTAETKIQFLPEHTGDFRGEVSIEDFPIVFDDIFYFMVHVSSVINVLEISSDLTPSTLEDIFVSDALFNYQRVNPYQINISALKNYQLITVEANSNLTPTQQQSLLDYVKNGGSLVIFPSKNQDNTFDYLLDKLNIDMDNKFDANQLSVNIIAQKYPFFADMLQSVPAYADYPTVKKYTSIRSKRQSAFVTLMAMQNDQPFLVLSSYGKGSTFIFASPLDESYTDLANNALVVPLFYKMAFLGCRVPDLWYILGRDYILPIADAQFDKPITITNDAESFEATLDLVKRDDDFKAKLYSTLPSSGFNKLKQDNHELLTTAWNSNRAESKMTFADDETIEATLKDEGFNLMGLSNADNKELQSIIAAEQALWKYFILLALLAILAEIVILRLWKS